MQIRFGNKYWLAILCSLVGPGAFVLADQGDLTLPISLDMQWYRFADPGGADPADPALAYPSENDGYETDRGEVGGESAVFSPDRRFILTSSRANARRKTDTPEFVYELVGNSSHLRLFDFEGNLLWDRARSRGPDEVNNQSGQPGPDGLPDDLPPGDGPGVWEDELEHAAFTLHETNLGRFAVAAGEDDKIEIWEVLDASGTLLPAPVLVRTLTIPGGRAAAFDSLGFSKGGELLAGGTEYFGTVEFWRATGHPDSWEHVGYLSHGGERKGHAVNEFDFSPDNRYLLTAGTNEKGGFFELEVERDPQGRIRSVSGRRLATMEQPKRSAKAARIDPVEGRWAVIASKDQRMLVFATSDLIQGEDKPMLILNNGIYHGRDRMTGVEIEPAGVSRSGRFLIQGGGPEEHFRKHPNTAKYRSSFFRIFDTGDLQEGAPEPDPIWVQPAFHTEFFDFGPEDAYLATSHDDGTVRLWKTGITEAVTIASEGFNEATEDHDRWTLGGSRATVSGGRGWGISHQSAARRERQIRPPKPAVDQDTIFVGLRGRSFLAAGDLDGEVHSLTLSTPWPLDGHSHVVLSFAAAASRGVFEAGDFLKVEADADGDGTFETGIANFLPDRQGNLQSEGGEVLNEIFQDFRVPIKPMRKGKENELRVRISAQTDEPGEEIAFDSLRLTGLLR